MTRSFQLHRGIVLVAVAAGLTLGVSACTPPMPPDMVAAQAEEAKSKAKENVEQTN